MADKEKSDKILQNLAQVSEVIEDVRQEMHRIQRETPYPVPVRFRVYGSTPFPVDMLRYDNCVPDEVVDAYNIQLSFDSGPQPWFITLRKFSNGEPSYARWASFGWKVET